MKLDQRLLTACCARFILLFISCCSRCFLARAVFSGANFAVTVFVPSFSKAIAAIRFVALS